MSFWASQSASRAILIAAWLTSAAAPAFAQDKEAAARYYRQGDTQFNLGHFAAAVELYKKAYGEVPDPAFLFNIAQSYRQLADCKQALFFYRRYLFVRPDAQNREAVESIVAELETGRNCRAAETEPANAPAATPEAAEDATPEAAEDATPKATEAATPDAATPDAAAPAELESAAPAEAVMARPQDAAPVASVSREAPRTAREATSRLAGVAVDLSLGPAFLAAGELDSPAQASFALGVGYRFRAGSVQLGAGVLLGYLPVAWEQGASSGTLGLTSAIANAGLGYPIGDRLRLRLDVGAGVQQVSGLGDMDNVFRDPQREVDGSLASFYARVGLGLELAMSSRVSLSVWPAVLSSASRVEGLREDIDSLGRFEMLLGAGLRL